MALFLLFMVPVFSVASHNFDEKLVTIDGQTITRSTPIIDNIPVEGADIINNSLSPKKFYAHFLSPKASFKLNAAEAIERAVKIHETSLLKDPYVENTLGIYEPIWLIYLGELRPAFKIRLPTLSVFDLKDIYVDAENGDILKIEDAAMFISAPAEAYTYTPAAYGATRSELKTVTLKNLHEIKENGFLNGQYLSVRTCCKYYTCPKEGPCDDSTKRCALKSHEGAMQLRELLTIPTDTLGLDPLIDLPKTISVDSVRCSNLPFARAGHRPGSNVLGFFETPIDDETPASEMDKFSEIQAYYSITSFFNHIRFLLNDPTWCLRKEAMSCNPDGSPTLDQHGQPLNPYKVFVNQLTPDMKIEGAHRDDPDNFLVQVLSGRGSKDNPIKIDSFARIGNAAFVPALSTLKKTTPRADEIISDLIKPYDHNVFFQGERDFAYDGDVVFHEFMHAVTTSLVGKLNSLGLDRFGINTEPGSLNEAWSDYFAAAFTEDPSLGVYASIKGGYGEVALRDIDNTASCPEHTIGEIHNDGLIWSGALWEIRSTINKSFGHDRAIDFDRVVLASLAQATNNESFKVQSKKLLNTIKDRKLPNEIYEIAKDVFLKRGITDCFRVNTLSTVDDKNRLNRRVKSMLFVASKNQIGLKNYAPMTSQLEIAIPAGAQEVIISWHQYLGSPGAMLGTKVSPNTTQNAIPLGALYSFDTPLIWKFEHSMSVPTKDGEFDNNLLEATYQQDYWQLSIPVDLKRCDQKTMYVSLLSRDFKYALENISVSFKMDDVDRSDCKFTGTGRKPIEKVPPGCSTVLPLDFMFFLTLLWILRQRKTP